MDRPTRRSLIALCLLSSIAMWTTGSAHSESSLAIRGYDPVAYFTVGRPTPGRSDLQYLWDEHVFRFATPEHREIFKADPTRYAPQFANFCAMALTRGELVEADPMSWLISDNRLYIFAKPVGAEVFERGLAGNVDKANERRHLISKP
jgi:hypothetical protein